ncbi:MAG: hypothetical protein JXQ27_05250 [Acidobacteria bacterium]|nr:hypothetical protein [Acidobacteriota bacterium]
MEFFSLEVVCYSGYRLHETPRRVMVDGREYDVLDILDRWYGVGYMYFKVRLAEGAKMLLRYDEWDDVWCGGWISADKS